MNPMRYAAVLWFCLAVCGTLRAEVQPDLSSAGVYPNPYDPGAGHTVVTFDGLPARATITIYTMAGEKVFETNVTTVDGTATWNAVNSDGKAVTTGVYIYLLTSDSGAKRKTSGKLVILK